LNSASKVRNWWVKYALKPAHVSGHGFVPGLAHGGQQLSHAQLFATACIGLQRDGSQCAVGCQRGQLFGRAVTGVDFNPQSIGISWGLVLALVLGVFGGCHGLSLQV
jgi:hypothetical protein